MTTTAGYALIDESTGKVISSQTGVADSTINILSTTTSIDAKIVGVTSLYTVPAGKTAIITNVSFRITAGNTITVVPTLGVGIAAGEDDILASQLLSGSMTVSGIGQIFLVDSNIIAVEASVIKLGIDVGATATTMTLAVDLLGYFV